MDARGPAARFDRRTFIARAGASAAALLAGPALAAGPSLAAGPALAAGPSRRSGTPRVAIVGAGIAGLSAALALHDRGVPAVVYEAQHRVGGRMHSERAFWEGGRVSEYGGELIDTSHTTLAALVERFGLRLDDVLAAVPKDAEQTIYERGAYYPQRQLFEDFRPVYRTLRAQIAASGGETSFARSTAAGRELDAMTLARWIERFVPGGRRSRIGTYLELQYVAEYGIEAERQSALNLVYWLGRQPAYDARTGEFVTLGPSDERFHIAGGNDRLPHAIAATLPPGAVRLGHRLEAIARRPDGRVALDVATPGGHVREIVDAAIVTVPFAVLRGLDLRRAGFDARKRAAIEELGYGDHSKLIVEFGQRFWRRAGAWPGISSGDLTADGRTYLQTWEATRAQAGTPAMLVDFAAASRSAALRSAAPYTTSLTPATARYAHEFVTELERALPGARRHFTGKATLSHLTSDPYARGSYSGWLAGQYTKFAGYERVRQGNVFFAGEHCSLALQGFMEGAAREGARAAVEVLRDAGRRTLAS